MEKGEKTKMSQFFSFEGIDGSGKSTVSKQVYQTLQKNGYKTMLTVEPTQTPIGSFVQQCIQTKCDPFVTTFSFLADRIQHCKQIQQWLDEGNIVLCDRYVDSTYAYQSAQLDTCMDDPLRWLQELSVHGILQPDHTFLFLIDPKDSLQRIQHRDTLIPFEHQHFLEKVDSYYRQLSQKEKRIICLDATQKIEDVVDQCYKHIVQNGSQKKQ